jgi:hypothetical protein
MRSSAEADKLLTGFPGPVFMRPSRRKWLLILLGCAIFTAGSIWMVLEGKPIGWFPLIFFGLGSVTALALLLPGAGGLKLDANGFEITNLFQRKRTRWQDTSVFEPVRIPPANILLVVYDDAKLGASSMAQIASSIAGRNGALPDTYGLSANDLASLMTQWRERALSAAGKIEQ